MRWKKEWILAGLGLAASLSVGVAAWAEALSRSQAILDARYPFAPSVVHAVPSPEAIARGRHLVVVTDCAACHGGDLTGRLMNLSSSTVYAPNLTVVTKTMSDTALDQAIRRGLRPDGRSELAMPSQAYAGFTDDEVAAIIADLRSLPAKGTRLPEPPPGPMLRINLATGELKTEVTRVAEARAPIEAGPAFERGRHLATVACGQCHGTDLGGSTGAPGPDLTVRGYYDRNQFHTLMRTGVGVSDDLELMSQTATTSFSHFTEDEIDSIFDYLMTRDALITAKPRT